MLNRRAFLALLPAPFVARLLPAPVVTRDLTQVTTRVFTGTYRYTITWLPVALATEPPVVSTTDTRDV